MTEQRAERLQRFEDLEVWKKAHRLVMDVYRVTAGFPAAERFGLVSQMRRAAVSVPANVAEGFKKRGIRDKVNFYNIAQGSLEELRYYLILSSDLGYLKDAKAMKGKLDEVARMLHALAAAISRHAPDTERRERRP